MTIYYSKESNGFYLDEIHVKSGIPKDAKKIPFELYRNLIDEQSKGKIIIPDENGMPILADVASNEDILVIKERMWRDSELRRADTELNKVQDADPKAMGSVASWRDYRKALRAWPENKDFPSPALRPKAPDTNKE